MVSRDFQFLKQLGMVNLVKMVVFLFRVYFATNFTVAIIKYGDWKRYDIVKFK